jgi:hypothetical protein
MLLSCNIYIYSNTWFYINGHEHQLKFFDRDEYCEDYSDPVYGKIDMNWYYSPIYDIILVMIMLMIIS